MQAIVRLGTSQYLVSPGQELLVDYLGDKTDSFEIREILLFQDDDSTQVGKPFLQDIKISAQVIDQVKGKKVRTAVYKAKSRYRKVKGFRASLTKIKILSMSKSS